VTLSGWEGKLRAWWRVLAAVTRCASVYITNVNVGCLHMKPETAPSLWSSLVSDYGIPLPLLQQNNIRNIQETELQQRDHATSNPCHHSLLGRGSRVLMATGFVYRNLWFLTTHKFNLPWPIAAGLWERC